MKTRKTTKFVAFLCITAMLICIFTGCGGGNKAKIEVVDESANTFNLVDQKTKEVIEYDTLIINGNKVIDTHCTSTVSPTVIFAFNEGDIVRDGGNVTINEGTAYTENAVFTYTLENGVLTLTESD